MSSCLNSCGDCGSAYQWPGCSRTGTRKSRAPSGVDRVRYGVSMSRKSCDSMTRRMIDSDLCAGADRAGRTGATQVEVAVLPAQRLVDAGLDVVGAVDRERHRLGLAEHLDRRRDDLDLTGSEVRVDVALGARGDSTSHERRTTRCAAPAPSARSRQTTCTMPLASRRSRKVTPPWSRRRATQPARTTSVPTSRAAQRRPPDGCGSRRSSDQLGGRARSRSARRRPARRVGVDLLTGADVTHLVPHRPAAGTRRTGCRAARRT